MPRSLRLFATLSPHHGQRIVFQQLEEGEHAFRVGVEPQDPRRPRQPQPCAFGDETTNVGVAVRGPGVEYRQDALRITRDVGTDAGFCAEAFRQLVLRPHRQIEVIESALRDEQRMRQVKERSHAGPDELVRRVFRSQRAKEHVNGVWIGRRQMRREDSSDVPPAIEKLECLEASARILHETSGREVRVNPCEICCKPAHQGGRKEGLESIGHAGSNLAHLVAGILGRALRTADQAVASRVRRVNIACRRRSRPAKRPLPVTRMTTSALSSTRFLLTIR